jgi:methyl coenzyme M reductase gamma subunit
MNRSHQPYSVHTPEELEAQRAPVREAMLREHARGRIEGHRVDLVRRIDNVKTLCVELGELLDHLEGGREEHRGVDTRSLSGRLRLVENELLAATDALADQLGLVAC